MFLSLYFVLSIHIFARFINSYLYPWLLGILLFDGGWGGLFVDMLLTELVNLIMRGMGGNIVGDTLSGESIIRVFFSLKLIQYKSNISFDNKYFWIFIFIYYMTFSFYKALNRNLTIVVLDFSI